ncbi:HDOD domain-containing protein [uncultured Desulfobacter sp.]|uniref:HDOD domain-containing protein n=1 Tax=uncultured Desulfobacter sp. TaxID=240139 RepID=UPI0029F526C8|nr:HDOD domain-containing protein [uncultured Desulfobacter sp.]
MKKTKVEFLKRFGKIRDLPSLPVIVTKVNAMLNDPNTTNDSLSRAIEKDQAIVFKMLQLVNSAFFGLREKISTTNEAAIILGFDAIRNIVLSLSTFNILDHLFEKKSNMHFNVDRFWRHSISVAVLSKYMAEQTKVGDPEKCFVCGLLHDMGKLMLAHYFPDDFIEVIEHARENGLMYLEAEKKVLPACHPEVGYFFIKKWDLPPHLANTIYSHHAVQPGAAFFDETMIVNMADGVINSYYADFLNNNTSPGNIKYAYFDPHARKRFNVWIESADKWFPKVETLIDDAWAFFL